MTSKLELIEKLKLENIMFVEDYVQMYFPKIILSIYNNYKTSTVLEDLKNLHVISIEEKNDYIKINFEKNEYVIIDMKQDAYNGPEALQLNTSNGQIFVWS